MKIRKTYSYNGAASLSRILSALPPGLSPGMVTIEPHGHGIFQVIALVEETLEEKAARELREEARKAAEIRQAEHQLRAALHVLGVDDLRRILREVGKTL